MACLRRCLPISSTQNRRVITLIYVFTRVRSDIVWVYTIMLPLISMITGVWSVTLWVCTICYHWYMCLLEYSLILYDYIPCITVDIYDYWSMIWYFMSMYHVLPLISMITGVRSDTVCTMHYRWYLCLLKYDLILYEYVPCISIDICVYWSMIWYCTSMYYVLFETRH